MRVGQGKLPSHKRNPLQLSAPTTRGAQNNAPKGVGTNAWIKSTCMGGTRSPCLAHLEPQLLGYHSGVSCLTGSQFLQQPHDAVRKKENEEDSTGSSTVRCGAHVPSLLRRPIFRNTHYLSEQ